MILFISRLILSRLILSFVTFIYGMVRFKKLSMPFKVLAFYLLFSLLDNIANRPVIAYLKNNYLILNIEAFGDFIFITLIYYHLLRNNLIKKVLQIALPIILLSYIYNSIFLQPFNVTFPGYAMATNKVLFIILSLLLFKQMLAEPLEINITKQGIFWFNIAVLLNSTTMFLNDYLVNYYAKGTVNPVVRYFWNYSDIIFNLILGIAIVVETSENNKRINA